MRCKHGFAQESNCVECRLKKLEDVLYTHNVAIQDLKTAVSKILDLVVMLNTRVE